MRRLKLFHRTLLLTAAAVALISASPASAQSTQLCLVDQHTCAAGNAATHVHFVSTEKAKFLSSITTVSCDILFLSLSIGVLALPQVIVGHFTYTNCTSGVGGCSYKQVSAVATLAFSRTGVEAGSASMTFELLQECGEFLHCVYSGVGLVPSVTGDLAAGHITISEQTVNKVKGFLCPSVGKLDILMASLSDFYISL